MSDTTIGEINVSRETLERLTAYLELLKKWNPAINLVAKSTIDHAWDRHFVDSAQVHRLMPENCEKWCDIGSGGGFPGLVCATLSMEFAPETQFTLIESDQRKAAFLRTVITELGLNAQVFSKRIEEVDPVGADILSARALAPLSKLLEFSERHLRHGGHALFLKGASFRDEISESLKSWHFSYEERPSITDPSAAILRIGDIKRV
ncbi:16S rRNA (guanine(527)-N(7))-methyltransferase RsmG [Celeribacter litoreus]|uniref:16S rRNA (guanine(527)-N(7))-methyltransferase RsmG n=1 Tax=Celeribacter litoreus TaxID=2876714 RepID=UPI001CCCEC21|nr:16S rRNA (guanine(527)-N(7))-methyltransferase RsmG [Celeribacter litoreus]MCA0042142.1 16S rRNA (guanine(527)-N(7))-methyltransferase RsmG [Celeribacter litoreus]